MFAKNFKLHKKNRVCLWQNNGYFGSQECLYYLFEGGIPKNAIFLHKQAYSCYLEDKKLYVTDLFVVGQINYIQEMTITEIIRKQSSASLIVGGDDELFSAGEIQFLSEISFSSPMLDRQKTKYE